MKKKGWLLIPICIAVLFTILYKTVFLIGYIPSASMEPTLKKGSIILGIRCFRELEKGNIIIFRHDGRLTVKRIAACEGDSIYIGDKCYIVPDNSFYVLGDNSENSYDSRYWADPFVVREDIIAKLI